MEPLTIQHFFLTRFNILLWNKAKDGQKVRTTKWLEHRFSLFEKYCLPSIKNQTCKNFEWLVLFDSMTPDSYKEKIAAYQKGCPQLTPVFVEPENGWRFAEIFREEIVKRLKAKRALSTYLDNDDALNVRFVEDIQQRAREVSDGTFINYDDGYQYYTDDKFMMRVHLLIQAGQFMMAKLQLTRLHLQKWRGSVYVPAKSSTAFKCLKVPGIVS